MGKFKFDVSLFEMTEEQRKSYFNGGSDPVEDLLKLSPEQRIAFYGTDFSEYLNKN